jgi:hypothetical protein
VGHLVLLGTRMVGCTFIPGNHEKVNYSCKRNKTLPYQPRTFSGIDVYVCGLVKLSARKRHPGFFFSCTPSNFLFVPTLTHRQSAPDTLQIRSALPLSGPHVFCAVLNCQLLLHTMRNNGVRKHVEKEELSCQRQFYHAACAHLRMVKYEATTASWLR